jgi:hypothetical protein
MSDRVASRAAAIRGEQAAAAAELAAQRATLQRNFDAAGDADRRRGRRLAEVLAMTPGRQRWLLPGDRALLREHQAREYERAWYAEAGTRLDTLCGTFRRWAVENGIPENVQGGWLLHRTSTSREIDVTPAWDRFTRTETEYTYLSHYIPSAPSEQGPYVRDRTLSNVQVSSHTTRTALAEGDIPPRVGSNSHPLPLPGEPDSHAFYALEDQLTASMAQWVAANPNAPWPQ